MHSQSPSHKGLQLTATHLGCSAQLSGRPSGAPRGAHPHPAPAWGPGGEKAPCQPRWAQDTPGPPVEGVLFLITILRPVNFLSICRCSSPYHKDEIWVLPAPGKRPCSDLPVRDGDGWIFAEVQCLTEPHSPASLCKAEQASKPAAQQPGPAGVEQEIDNHKLQLNVTVTVAEGVYIS